MKQQEQNGLCQAGQAIDCGNSGAFIAGTLIHSSRGLVPIEQLQAGDWVLSRSDIGGDNSYQVILNNYRATEKPLYLLRFYIRNRLNPDKNRSEYVVAAQDQFFRTVDQGWLALSQIMEDDQLMLASNEQAVVLSVDPLYCTGMSHMAWVQRISWKQSYESARFLIDFNADHLRIMSEDFQSDAFPDPRLLKEDGSFFTATPFKRATCNLEVANTHTYFATSLGIWAHDIVC